MCQNVSERIYTCLALWIVLVQLKTVWAIMGSLPENLPPCLHSGVQNTNGDRYGCTCPDSTMDRQCKVLRVNVAAQPIELARNHVLLNLSSHQSVHVGFEFITSEKSGNGTLMTLKNKSKIVQLQIDLEFGRLSLKFSYSSILEIILFPVTALVLNDNAWHSVDLFLNTQANGTLTVNILVDRCKYSNNEPCSISKTISPSTTIMELGDYLQLGDDSTHLMGHFGGCFDNVMINRDLVDFYSAVWDQTSRKGCPDSEDGCFRSGKHLCGSHGICRNAMIATEMFTCQCQAGYKPNVSSIIKPYRWPCYLASSGWVTNTEIYTAQFKNEIPRRFRISLRTRTKSFTAFAVAAWKLYLTINDGTPELKFDSWNIQLTGVNVTDGNWHLFEVTFTPKFMDMRIDKLDGIFYGARIFSKPELPRGVVDIVIAKQASGTCLDDVWVDSRNIWPDFEQDYPLETVPDPQYTRYIDWSQNGLISGCPTGEGSCAVGKRCDETSICVDEWKGYRCTCEVGMVMNNESKCIPIDCLKTPCVQGDCIAINSSSTKSNFTCQCFSGWEGPLCDRQVSMAGFAWWWILLLILLILLIIILVIIFVCCCVQRRKKNRSQLKDLNTGLQDQQLGTDSHFNDPWSTGEKDFNGPIDYTVLSEKSGFPSMNSVQSLRPNGFKKSVTKPVAIPYAVNPNYVARDYGQKTTDVPPWENFDKQPNSAIKIDQVLEYGYEGYDGKPPPEFCPMEPVPSDDDNDDDEGDNNGEGENIPNLNQRPYNPSPNTASRIKTPKPIIKRE